MKQNNQEWSVFNDGGNYNRKTSDDEIDPNAAKNNNDNSISWIDVGILAVGAYGLFQTVKSSLPSDISVVLDGPIDPSKY